MKKIELIKKRWEGYIDKLDEKWQELPINKQRIYMIYFFTTYCLMTTAVILKVWYDTKESKNSMSMEHIENPVLKKNKSLEKNQDSLSIILKNKINETR